MHNDLFPSELGYQGAISLAEGLRRSGLLTEDDLAKARTLLIDAYRPPLGSLFAIRMGNGANGVIDHAIQETYDARSTI